VSDVRIVLGAPLTARVEGERGAAPTSSFFQGSVLRDPSGRQT
jgi:hypothetical protein